MLTRLSDPTVTVLAKNIHGTRPERENNQYGTPSGGHVGDMAEEDREHEHQAHRLQDGPRRAERGLAVAHRDVADGELPRQVAVTPQLARHEHPPETTRRLQTRDGLVSLRRTRQRLARRLLHHLSHNARITPGQADPSPAESSAQVRGR